MISTIRLLTPFSRRIPPHPVFHTSCSKSSGKRSIICPAFLANCVFSHQNHQISAHYEQESCNLYILFTNLPYLRIFFPQNAPLFPTLVENSVEKVENCPFPQQPLSRFPVEICRKRHNITYIFQDPLSFAGIFRLYFPHGFPQTFPDVVESPEKKKPAGEILQRVFQSNFMRKYSAGHLPQPQNR